MSESQQTRPTLLDRIRDPEDNRAWKEFVALYAPIVYRFTRSRNLAATDAADVVQEVMRAVAGGIGGSSIARAKQSSAPGCLPSPVAKLRNTSSA